MMVMGRNIREGDRYFYKGQSRQVIKITPLFHSVILTFDDTTDTVQLGDQDWFHVEREDG